VGLPGIPEIEMAGLKAWPATEVERDGGWVRRAAGGYTRRANSVQCLDPADDENAPARIADSPADARLTERVRRPGSGARVRRAIGRPLIEVDPRT